MFNYRNSIYDTQEALREGKKKREKKKPSTRKTIHKLQYLRMISYKKRLNAAKHVTGNERKSEMS